MGRSVRNAFLSLIGAAVGGALGVGLFSYLLQQGFYALILPGAGLGLGCHLASPNRSRMRGIVCGVAALGLGLFSEAWFRFFNLDPSLRYFFAHLQDLKPWTFLMIGLGGAFGFWWGRESSPWLHPKPARSSEV